MSVNNPRPVTDPNQPSTGAIVGIVIVIAIILAAIFFLMNNDDTDAIDGTSTPDTTISTVEPTSDAGTGGDDATATEEDTGTGDATATEEDTGTGDATATEDTEAEPTATAGG